MANNRQQQQNGSGTAVARRDVKAALRAPETLEQIRRVLPPGLGEKVADRFVSVALTYADNEDIAKCAPRSVVKCVVQAAQLGVEVGGPRKHSHIVPFGREAELIMGYGGLIYLGKRDGVIKAARCHAVYEGDEFYVELGSEERIVHRPSLHSDRDPEDVTHVYAIVTLPDGTEKFDFMTRAQVERVRQASNSRNSPGWKNHWDEMAKKVVLKRVFKTVPMGDELNETALAKALELDNRNDFDVSEAVFSDRASSHAEAATRTRLDALKERIQGNGNGREVGVQDDDQEHDEEEGDDQEEWRRLNNRYFAMVGKLGWSDAQRKLWQEQRIGVASCREWGLEHYEQAIELLDAGETEIELPRRRRSRAAESDNGMPA